MDVLHTDLDNTLIYSEKRDIGEQKKCAEIYQGREISFVTDKTRELLKKVEKHALIVPTTTRTTEQYQRIYLETGAFEYALTCNGGVLLHHGEEDLLWYQESKELIQDSIPELERAYKILEADSNRVLEVRYIKELFLFTKTEKPELLRKVLEGSLDLSRVDVFCNGIKVYVLPKELTKGAAVRRFRKKVNAEKVYATGDSEFDISMLREADLGIAPIELETVIQKDKNIICMGQEKVFSESLLEYLLQDMGSRK